jgi:hypothetical protein
MLIHFLMLKICPHILILMHHICVLKLLIRFLFDQEQSLNLIILIMILNFLIHRYISDLFLLFDYVIIVDHIIFVHFHFLVQLLNRCQ